MKPIKFLDLTLYESICYYENQMLYCGDNSHKFKIYFKYKFGLATLKDAIIELHIKNPSGELIVLPKLIESDMVPTEIELPENILLNDGDMEVEILIKKDSFQLTHPNVIQYGVRSRLSEDPTIKPPHHIEIDELLNNIENKTTQSIDRILKTEGVVAELADNIVKTSELEMIKISSAQVKVIEDKAVVAISNVESTGTTIISDLNDTKDNIITELNTTGTNIKADLINFIETNDLVLQDEIARIVADVSYDGEYLIITRVNGDIDKFKIEATLGQAIVDLFKVDTKKCSGDDVTKAINNSYEDGYTKTVWVPKETVVSADNLNKIEDALAYAISKIADLEYTPVAIQTFNASKNIVERGDIARGVVLHWVLNNNKIKRQSMNNTEISAIDRSYVIGTIYSDANYRLEVEDLRGATATSTTSIKFVSGRYYGASITSIYDSVFLNSLTKELSESKSNTFIADASNNRYIYYAIPTRLGQLNFKVNGFDGGFNKVATINHSNVHGYTESYDIYRSTNNNLGATTVSVS